MHVDDVISMPIIEASEQNVYLSVVISATKKVDRLYTCSVEYFLPDFQYRLVKGLLRVLDGAKPVQVKKNKASLLLSW